RGFALLRRSANTVGWRAAVRGVGASGPGAGGGVGFWSAPTMPRALAVMRTREGRPGASSRYVLGVAGAESAGWVHRYSLEGYQAEALLPAGQILKAA